MMLNLYKKKSTKNKIKKKERKKEIKFLSYRLSFFSFKKLGLSTPF